MKEIISAVIFVVGLYGGTVALDSLNQAIKREALKKASKGLPSLKEMNRGFKKIDKSVGL